jgi:hypothetical protein
MFLIFIYHMTRSRTLCGEGCLASLCNSLDFSSGGIQIVVQANNNQRSYIYHMTITFPKFRRQSIFDGEECVLDGFILSKKLAINGVS